MLSKRSDILMHTQLITYIHGAIPLAFPLPLLVPPCLPFASPLCPLLLTWHPPAVTGIVHLPLRLLVN